MGLRAIANTIGPGILLCPQLAAGGPFDHDTEVSRASRNLRHGVRDRLLVPRTTLRVR